MRALPFVLALLPLPAQALTPQDVLEATYDGGDLPDGQSAVTMALQVMLDRAGISPGIIDGYKGGMSESAIRGFERREGMEVDGILDQAVWDALSGDGGPVLVDYTITAEDASGLTDEIPEEVEAKAQMDELGYVSVSEKLAERFHMDEDVLKALNPDASFREGDTISVAAPGERLEAEIARITVSKTDRRATAFDADGNIVSDYPVTVGSDELPSPSGTHDVLAVAMDPTYTYNAEKNNLEGGPDEVMELPAGPNGPVGSVWIDLSEPTFGLHGTDTPAKLFENRSHGCVRFTNWDVEELAHMVQPDTTIVEFLE